MSPVSRYRLEKKFQSPSYKIDALDDAQTEYIKPAETTSNFLDLVPFMTQNSPKFEKPRGIFDQIKNHRMNTEGNERHGYYTDRHEQMNHDSFKTNYQNNEYNY